MKLQTLATRLFATFAATVLSVTAFGFSLLDGDIKIVKNPNAPTLAIKYSGVRPVRAEIRINGIQAGIKEIKSTKNLGIVTFGFSPDRLQSGDNVVEAFLYDKGGNVLGSEKLTMKVQKEGRDPVYMKFPKMGQTVQGAVEMSVGFGTEMRDAYVSFFVDKEFRSMKNFPPYAYIWDTTKETNGWHEIEAWTFDATQSTKKSQPVRVYVNNPGGQTPRETTKPIAKPPVKSTTKQTTSTTQGTLSSSQPKVNVSNAQGGTTTPAANTSAAATTSTPSVELSVTASNVGVPISKEIGAKAPEIYAESAGNRISQPKKPSAAKSIVKPVIKPISTTPSTPVKRTAIKPGTKLASDGTFPVYLDGVEIKFDVEPRVTNGVPLSPFRHLFEGAGGKVDWKNNEKVATGNGLGYDVWIQIGSEVAKVNGKEFTLDYVAFLEQGRTIVPLSFLNAALNFNIEFDAGTGHVLITSKK